MMTVAEVARTIDHALLHPTLTDREIREGCEQARRYRVATACVKPYAECRDLASEQGRRLTAIGARTYR